MAEQPAPHPSERNPAANEQLVLLLFRKGRLGYLAASEEWTNGADPLSEGTQHAADRLADAGRIPDYRTA